MVECNICGWTGKEFGPLHSPGYARADPNVFCPSCGSYERHRALVYYLVNSGILPARGRALEVGSGVITAYKKFLGPWPLSSRIVVRCAWLNMRCLLLLDSSVHATELVLNALDLALRIFQLATLHLQNQRSSGFRRNEGGHAL